MCGGTQPVTFVPQGGWSRVLPTGNPSRSTRTGRSNSTPPPRVRSASYRSALSRSAPRTMSSWRRSASNVPGGTGGIRGRAVETTAGGYRRRRTPRGPRADMSRWCAGVCARYLAAQVRYVGPLRHAPYRPFPSAPDPDLDNVGVEGEYVASVLQANRGTERDYPVPGGATEQLSLLEAVKRWMVDFGLAADLKVREDTPLVLGIDVRPPGLEREVTLSAVGVGVSQVLPVIVQCLVAGPGALVVLEQPELHLHPAAQQRLADFLLACTAWGQNLPARQGSPRWATAARRQR